MKDGNKTGVLAGGLASEFQERVLSERLKLERRAVEQLEQCDKVSSSSPRQDDTKDDDDMEVNTEEDSPIETEEAIAERKLKEREEEIKKLEEKRKLLENYYKKKLEEKKQKGDSKESSVLSENQGAKNKSLEESKNPKEKEERKEGRRGSRGKKKRKASESSETSQEEEEESSSSSSRSEKDRHKRKRRSKSKSKYKKSKHKKSRERSRHKSRKHKKRSRRHSSSSSSSEESSSSEIRSSNTSSRSTSEKPGAKKIKSENVKVETDPRNVFQSTENELKRLLEASKPSLSPTPTTPPQIKIKSLSQLVEVSEHKPEELNTPLAVPGEGNDEVFSDSEQTEGKSFLESVEKLDKFTSKSSSSRDKSKSSHQNSSSSKKSKSSSHKSSSSHRSSSRHKSSSHHHRSKHKSSSHHKSSSSTEKRKSEKKSSRVEETEEDEGKSPIPDFSEELALLPDFSTEDPGDEYDNVAGGLEELFAGVEDENELQRIFEQYEPQAGLNQDEASLRKQRQLEQKDKATPSSSVVGKKRVAHEGSESSERRPLHMKKPALKTPAQAMHDRYKKLQQMRQQQMIEKRLTELTEEDPGEGTSASFSSGKKPRIAHTSSGRPPVVMSKTQQQLAARQKTRVPTKEPTPAVTNAKGSQRVAHTPSSETVRRPLVTPDRNSKVPTTVRQKYLNSIIEECLKISGGEELEAFTRAEKEEAECCKKASSRMFYLNLVVNCIKKLRAEAAAVASRQSNKSTPGSAEKRNLLTTHFQVLAGKAGTVGTWSNERAAALRVEDVDERLLYAVMKNYVLTEQQLLENGYPRADPTEPGKVTMKREARRQVDPEKARIVAQDEARRLCDRCGEIYLVGEEGRQQDTSQPCVHHWGRLFRRKGNRGELVFHQY